MFRFSLALLSVTFLILSRNERDMIKNAHIDLRVRYPLFMLGFSNTLIFPTDFREILIHQMS